MVVFLQKFEWRGASLGFFQDALSVCVCVCGSDRRNKNDKEVLRQDWPLVVSSKEDPAFPVCSLCQGENY